MLRGKQEIMPEFFQHHVNKTKITRYEIRSELFLSIQTFETAAFLIFDPLFLQVPTYSTLQILNDGCYELDNKIETRINKIFLIQMSMILKNNDKNILSYYSK